MTFDEVLVRFNAKPTGDGYKAHCPAHEDGKESLSISLSGDKILVKCFAGCNIGAVLAAVRLTTKDLFTNQGGTTAAPIIATYLYRDPRGEVRYRKQRTADKRFFFARPDGHGGWIASKKQNGGKAIMGGVERFLYRLNELAGHKQVFVVEGEKDADRLWTLNFPATTNDVGASENLRKPKWTDALTGQLKAIGVTSVLCLPDNDDAGRAHMQAVARSCHAAGIEVRIVVLPDLPVKGDVSDYLYAGHTDLLERCDAAPLYTPPMVTHDDPDGFITNDDGKILPGSPKNIRRALTKLHVELSFNNFANKPLVKYGDRSAFLGDAVRDRLWLDIEDRFDFLPTAGLFDVVLKDTAQRNAFHPVRDYLSGLMWDGTPRIDAWLVTYGKAADTDYVNAVGRLVLIAAVRRVMQPGCKFDELLILESDQGLLKSSALRVLCPNADWFSDDLPLHVEAKQIIERTAGKWIIEAADLSGKNKSSIEQLKASLSRQVDGPVRLAYAHLPDEIPRQFIIIGTTNSHKYLKDSTGNRRFWPVRVQRFDVDGIQRDRDQLWAEAVKREASGESIRLDQKLYRMAELQQERRRLEDPWEPELCKMFEDAERPYRFTTDELWNALGVPTPQRTEAGAARIAAIMESLGFEPKKARALANKDNKTIKRWCRQGNQGELDDEPET